MCQPKDKGGKRCFTHMMGTMASITMASVMSGLEESFVTKVTRSLRKEGKNLPAPTEEEIVAFARNNQFISKHDSSIPENKRAMLVRRWQKAEMEKPDGAGFHAWKHTLVESVVRWKRTSMAIGLAGIIATTSACSGGALPNENSPVATSSPTTISQTATPTTSPIATENTHDKTVELGSVIKTSKGEYTQVKLPSNSPAFKYNPGIVSDSAKSAYSEEEIKDGQKFIANFVTSEVIDTPLNGNAETSAQWWARNESKISPTAKEDAKNSLGQADGSSSTSFVAEEPWQQEATKKDYSYVYKAGTPRVKHLQLSPTKVFADDDGGLAVQMDVDYQMPYKSASKDGTMYVSGQYIFSAKKDSNNQWQINGYQRKTTTKTDLM